MTIQEVIRKLVKDWDLHPFDINQGDCGEFAHQVTKKFKGAYLLCSDVSPQHPDYNRDLHALNVGHSYIEYADRFYDAEAPDGVSRPECLPAFMREWAPVLFESTLDAEPDALEALGGKIDDCIAAAKELDREGMEIIIKLLREARNKVVGKTGQ